MQARSRRIALSLIAAAVALVLAGSAQAVDRPDAWVTTKVKMALLTNEGLTAARDINVDTVDSRVTLHGKVATEAEKAKAEEVAKGVQGASQFRNLIQVVPSSKEQAMNATDDQIAERVKTKLKSDKTLSDSSISVQSVNSGVVLLAGKAATLSDAYRAIDAASSVPGVKRVASEIKSPDEMADAEMWYEGAYDKAKYEASSASDIWVTTAAKMRLIANSETPGFDINVDTNDGVVTLFGVVASEQAKRAAETEVRKIGGVKNVENDLQVVATAQQERTQQKDAEIDKAIEQRLASLSALEDASVKVDVSNGVARLTGTVKSRTDQVAALTAARSTAGVVRVIDDMRLAPPAVSAR
jgi:osmotically-inducible protein OsmY